MAGSPRLRLFPIFGPPFLLQTRQIAVGNYESPIVRNPLPRIQNAWGILFISGIMLRIDIGNRKRSLSVNLNHGFIRGPSIMVHLRRCFGKAARA